MAAKWHGIRRRRWQRNEGRKGEGDKEKKGGREPEERELAAARMEEGYSKM